MFTLVVKKLAQVQNFEHLEQLRDTRTPGGASMGRYGPSGREQYTPQSNSRVMPATPGGGAGPNMNISFSGGEGTT